MIYSKRQRRLLSGCRTLRKRKYIINIHDKTKTLHNHKCRDPFLSYFKLMYNIEEEEGEIEKGKTLVRTLQLGRHHAVVGTRQQRSEEWFSYQPTGALNYDSSRG